MMVSCVASTKIGWLSGKVRLLETMLPFTDVSKDVMRVCVRRERSS